MDNAKMPEIRITGRRDLASALTKREEFAKAAMQGLLVNMGRNTCYTEGDVAVLALKSADALLAELAK
jgi:hypothetical protein